MLWGCMSAAGCGNLHFIEGTMDKKMYLDILKQNLAASTEKLGISDSFAFYQDNDPKHSAIIVQNWLLSNCPKVFKTPAQSPDINVIEHVWGELKRRLRKRKITKKEELKMAIIEEWQNIEPSFCKKLVESVPRRLEAIINSKGYSTKY